MSKLNYLGQREEATVLEGGSDDRLNTNLLRMKTHSVHLLNLTVGH